MGAKFFALLALGVGGLMLADLLIHPKGTQVLTSSAIQAEKIGTNGLLGTTS